MILRSSILKNLPLNINRIQSLIAQKAGLAGWLFCNFAHRDTLTDSLLSLNGETVSTRKWFYIIPASGDPYKIVHAIETDILTSLPGSTFIYASQRELQTILRRFSSRTFASQVDRDLSVISTLDAGTLRFLEELDIRVESAATLIQQYKGLLSPQDIENHLKASDAVYEAMHSAWDFIAAHFHDKKTLTEYDVQCHILQHFKRSALISDHPPIVAFGSNSGNPHYEVSLNSEIHGGIVQNAVAKKGDVIQLDMWAAYPDGIYADISWVGIYDTVVPQKIADEFDILAGARDTVYATLQEKYNSQECCTGFELDEKVRHVLCEAGFEHSLKHRSGHGIDTKCHGSGVNLDSIEFPDHRPVLEGSCFSVEPGLYFSDYGMRTEINIYISQHSPIISGEIQKRVLTV